MTIKTANGKNLTCDLCVESPDPDRLYIHFIDIGLLELIPIISSKKALPMEGYDEYVELESISDSGNGVNVRLRKKTEVTA